MLPSPTISPEVTCINEELRQHLNSLEPHISTGQISQACSLPPGI